MEHLGLIGCALLGIAVLVGLIYLALIGIAHLLDQINLKRRYVAKVEFEHIFKTHMADIDQWCYGEFPITLEAVAWVGYQMGFEIPDKPGVRGYRIDGLRQIWRNKYAPTRPPVPHETRKETTPLVLFGKKPTP